ncbi:hypothetical protein NC653_010622 [Populus alba x Populus x berolinensis]|uniref:Uncharacterized protein n=1 Tax=Populus alba x Populus x berolinensis TaxID=444605 RepID=A0AAD6R0C4_9ROSI|nr:hypothetical protein NC653_010622 [Populus alba x Populus x berolinensis]
MEENVLALLDDSSDSKHTPDANDDRIGFLEAARSSCIVTKLLQQRNFFSFVSFKLEI